MVRLGVSPGTFVRLLREEFQFHYGAIGSVIPTYTNMNATISIPLWCDWELVFLLSLLLVQQFQFHYGAIGRI